MSNKKDKKSSGMSLYATIDKLDESEKLLSPEDQKKMKDLFKMMSEPNGKIVYSGGSSSKSYSTYSKEELKELQKQSKSK